jgi:hypothetical protein
VVLQGRLMLVECNKCKKEILTECDIHLVIPNQNYAINCGCELLQKEQQLEKENAMMLEALKYIAKDKNCGDGCKCEKHTAILTMKKINKDN